MGKHKPTGNAVGRPKIEANWRRLEKEIIWDDVIYWIGLQCTAEEIAGCFRVSVDTLDKRILEHFGCNFTELRKKLGFGAEKKKELREIQFELAKKSAIMAIFLGKNWLGQKDSNGAETQTALNAFEQFNQMIENKKAETTNE